MKWTDRAIFGRGVLAALASMLVGGPLFAEGIGILARNLEPAREPPGPHVSSVLAFDEAFSYTLDDGCTYGATIRGTLRPVLSGPSAGQKVEPDLAIAAALVCPNAETSRITERIAGTGPIAWAEVEGLIERRSTILRETAGKRCAYVPDVDLPGETLVVRGVTYLCQAPRR